MAIHKIMKRNIATVGLGWIAAAAARQIVNTADCIERKVDIVKDVVVRKHRDTVGGVITTPLPPFFLEVQPQSVHGPLQAKNLVPFRENRLERRQGISEQPLRFLACSLSHVQNLCDHQQRASQNDFIVAPSFDYKGLS